MTTPETTAQAYRNMESLFLSLLEKLDANSDPRQGPTDKQWLRPTISAIINLPWGETNLPDDRKPPQYDTAAELTLLMLRNLDDDIPPPTSVNPTGDGGVTAQWHLKGYDLEIFCEPATRPEYYLKTEHTEFEGPVYNEESPDQLQAHLKLMPREQPE